MSTAKIQSGDQVKVISGKFKGTIGQVTQVIKKTYSRGVIKTRAAVSTVPKIANYRKSTVIQGQNYPGSMNQVDRFIDVSNLSLLTSDLKLSKVKISIDENGKKTRILKKNGALVNKNIIEKVKSLESNNK